jgi:hypothetical protein
LQSITIILYILTRPTFNNEGTAVILRGRERADNGLCGMAFERAEARVIHKNGG